MLNKILVTGGSGFIGSNLIKYLLEKKYKVINVDKLNYSSTPDKYKSFTRSKNYEFIKADLRDPKSVALIITEECDEVYQLAADMGGAEFIFSGEINGFVHDKN